MSKTSPLAHIYSRITLGNMARAPFEGRTNGQQETCNLSCNIAANQFYSDVAHFTPYIKPVLQQIRLLTGLTDMAGETQHRLLTCFASIQNKLHIFVRHSRVFPCLSRLLLPSFPFFLSYQTSATKDLGGTLLYRP